MARKPKKQIVPQEFPLDQPVQPKHVIKDRGKVVIDVDQNDQGTVERHRQGMAIDDTGMVEAGVIGGVIPTITSTGGLPRRVMKSASVLDVMFKNETINQEQYQAGLLFEKIYTWSHRDVYATVSYDQVSGSMSREDFMINQTRAIRELELLVDMLGGKGSSAAVAMCCVVGKGWSFSLLKLQSLKHEQYWRGALLAGLDILVDRLRKKSLMKKKNDDAK